MSQSTRLYTRMTFFDKTYNSKDEVERDLEIVHARLEHLKQEQIMLAMMTEPGKFAPKDQSPMYYVKNSAEQIFEDIKDAAIGEWKLEILLDRWEECHTRDGLGKYPPEEAKHTYIDGDFVFTDKYPTPESHLQ